eukprot:2484710-Ditylum_brightwellii.AAC.1
MFVGGLFVEDNEKNLPLHIAAASLVGDVGLEAIYLLLDEARRQQKSIDSCHEESTMDNGLVDNAKSAKHHDGDESECTSVTAPTSAAP